SGFAAADQRETFAQEGLRQNELAPPPPKAWGRRGLRPRLVRLAPSPCQARAGVEGRVAPPPRSGVPKQRKSTYFQCSPKLRIEGYLRLRRGAGEMVGAARAGRRADRGPRRR